MMSEGKLDIREELYENRICSMIGQELQKHYPGWRWWVECRLPTGLATVTNLDLNGDYGFSVPLTNYLSNPDNTIIRRAGGEILERYGQERKRKPEVVEIERDLRGNADGDHS